MARVRPCYGTLHFVTIVTGVLVGVVTLAFAFSPEKRFVSLLAGLAMLVIGLQMLEVRLPVRVPGMDALVSKKKPRTYKSGPRLYLGQRC